MGKSGIVVAAAPPPQGKEDVAEYDALLVDYLKPCYSKAQELEADVSKGGCIVGRGCRIL